MEPLLIDIPEQIETERLILRCPRVGEGKMINDAIQESIHELRRWMPWAEKDQSVEDTEVNTRKAIAKFLLREDLRLHLHLKDGSFVGGSGLHRIDWNVPKFEIGYWIRTSMAGKGLMTEAVKGIARFALDELKAARVEIRCDDLNQRSWRVAERAGFTLEGILRNECRQHEDKLRDTRVYSRIAAK